jgi:acetylornithine deacetylase/succinyl-diaminopimelate desuccinylase-like protein
MPTQSQLDQFVEFLKFPSISTDPKYKSDLVNCSNWLVTKLSSLGFEAKSHPTPGHPIVLAKSKQDPSKKTLLIYGHYDVQPVDPISEWTHPPFEPHISNGVIYARGSTDNKGQILTHIFGVEEYLKKNKELPVNIIFLIEGEEEVGGINLGKFLEDHKEELKSNIIIVSDGHTIDEESQSLECSLRGILCFDIIIKSLKTDVHSGLYGGALANPALILSQLLAKVHDANGRILIEGFHAGALPTPEWEKKLPDTLHLTEEHLIEEAGAKGLWGDKSISAYSRIWSHPTFELNGIYSGFNGEGSKTIIPSYASAKVSCRLVPFQDPDTIFSAVEKFFKKHVPDNVDLEIVKGHIGYPYYIDPEKFDVAIEFQESFKNKFPTKKIYSTRCGASIPVVSEFKQILGIDTLLLGLAFHDCGMHSPDENFHLSQMDYGIELNHLLLEAFVN